MDGLLSHPYTWATGALRGRAGGCSVVHKTYVDTVVSLQDLHTLRDSEMYIPQFRSMTYSRPPISNARGVFVRSATAILQGRLN